MVGRTGFCIACVWQNNGKIVEMLIEKSTRFNIDLNAKDDNGWTGFHLACMNGNLNI